MSLSALLLGYGASIAFIGRLVDQAGTAIDGAVAASYPAAQAARDAALGMERLLGRYEDAVVYGEIEHLVQAQEISKRVILDLQRVATVLPADDPEGSRAIRTADSLLAFTVEALPTYRDLASDDRPVHGGDDPVLLAELKKNGDGLRSELDGLSAALALRLSSGLKQLQDDFAVGRNLGLTIFAMAMLVSVLALSITLRSAVLRPLRHLLGRIRSVGGGTESMGRHGNEIEAVVDAFERMRERVASTIADLEREATRRIQTEGDYRGTLESIGDGVLVLDAAGRVQRANPAARQFLSAGNDGPIAREIGELLRPIGFDARNPPHWTVDDAHPEGVERLQLLDGNDRQRRVLVGRHPLRGPRPGTVLVLHDVTEQALLEQQLHQSQKMESIGQLAGGVAHDFNNMLTGILGSADILRERIEEPRLRRLIEVIVDSAERAAELTRRLLSFARKDRIQRRSIDLHRVVADAVDLTRPSLPPQIELVLALTADYAVVDGDAASLQNAIINLLVNARDAMPDGGCIEVRSEDIVFGPDDLRADGRPRPYGPGLRLRITDTGSGMSPEVLEKAFEPFFTTKAVGKGTGLGLASVYGTVREHDGVIRAESTVGTGTVFTIDLPVVPPGTVATLAAIPSVVAHGTVLVVDDEDTVRETVVAALQALGYQTVEATDGAAGLAIFEREQRNLTAVILDLAMPRMDGHATLRRMRELSTTMPILLASGYLTPAAAAELRRDGVTGILAKPYRLAALGEALARARDSMDRVDHGPTA